jgi:membrane protease YdiL (CAAX protease family)
METLRMLILSLLAGAAVYLLLPQPLQARLSLSVAASCFFYLFPTPASLVLAALVFWDRMNDDAESRKFALLPALGAAGVIFFWLLPLGVQALQPVMGHLGISPPDPVSQPVGWLLAIRSCLAVPLLEEYLCRNWFLGRVLRQRFDVRDSLAISSLVFAVLHFQPAALVAHALAGVIYGWLYENHGFWSAATAHSLTNSLSLILSLFR